MTADAPLDRRAGPRSAGVGASSSRRPAVRVAVDRSSASSGRCRPLGLFVSSFRPANDIRADRLVGGAAAPVRGRAVDARELRDGPHRRGHGQRVHQQPDRDDPADGDPDHGRRVRRLRVRLDALPAAGAMLFLLVVALLVVPLQMSLIPVLRLYTALDLNGTFLGVWLAHAGVRAAAGHLPALQLHRQLPGRPVRDGQHRRRVALPDRSAGGAAPVGAGARLVRDLPVPVGLERPAGRARVPRAPTERSVMPPGSTRWSGPRAGVAPAHRGGVRDDDRAADRVPALQRYFVRGILAGSVKG